MSHIYGIWIDQILNKQLVDSAIKKDLAREQAEEEVDDFQGVCFYLDIPWFRYYQC